MRQWIGRWLIVGIAVGLLHGVVSAQVVALGVRRPGPAPRIGVGSISMMASPGMVNFSLVSKGTAVGSSPVAVTTSWSGLTLLSTVTIYAFFANASAALSGGTPVISIPSSCVFGQNAASGGMPTSFTPFTQNGTLSAASLELFNETIILGLGSETRTDVLSLEINLSTIPQLPAGTYTGVLMLQTQVF